MTSRRDPFGSLSAKQYLATAAGLVIGTVLQTVATSWSESSISFVVPQTQPDGSAWTLDQPLEVRLVAGAPSITAVHLTITA